MLSQVKCRLHVMSKRCVTYGHTNSEQLCLRAQVMLPVLKLWTLQMHLLVIDLFVLLSPIYQQFISYIELNK